jgi:uncharacterized protein YqeY
MSWQARKSMQDELTAAIKAGDGPRVDVLRTTLAAISNAEAVDLAGPTTPVDVPGDVERRRLSDDDITAIIAGERDELSSTAQHLHRLGQTSRARELDARAAILGDYLWGDYLWGDYL